MNITRTLNQNLMTESCLVICLHLHEPKRYHEAPKDKNIIITVILGSDIETSHQFTDRKVLNNCDRFFNVSSTKLPKKRFLGNYK